MRSFAVSVIMLYKHVSEVLNRQRKVIQLTYEERFVKSERWILESKA